MNTPSPLIPQGSLLDQKNKSRSRVKIAFTCVVGAHIAAILVALLAQGCERNKTALPDATTPQTIVDTNPVPDYASNNLPPFQPDTNTTPVQLVVSNPPPQLPPEASTIVPAGQAQEYVVLQGDTFSSIAPKFHVSVKALQTANPTVNPTRMKPGQKLVIPAPTAPGNGATSTVATTGDSGAQTYVVKAGDNLTKIAAHFHVTINALRRANNMTTDRIKAGDKLKIPAATAPANAGTPAPQ